MISLEILEEPDQRWNERLLESKYGTIYQTKEYAFYTNNTFGWKSNFLLFINSKGDIVGQLLFTKQKFSESGFQNKLLRLLTRRKIHRWSYGPVLFFPKHDEEIIKSLSQYLISLGGKVIGYEHPLSSGLLSKLDKPFKVNNWATFLIDLSNEKEIIWKNLDKHSARKNIERSIKRRVIVKEMKNSDLYTYYEILLETKRKVNNNIDFQIPIKEISKYLLGSIILISTFYLTSDFFIRYQISIFDFLPGVIIEFLICASSYLGFTYLVDKKTRIFFKAILNELLFKRSRYE